MFRLLGQRVATPFRHGSMPRMAVAAVRLASPPSYCYSTEEDFELDYRKMFEVHNLRVLPEDVKKQQAAKYHNNFKELFFDPHLTKEVKVARTEREWFHFRRQYEKPILQSLYQAHQEKKELVRQEKKKIHKLIEEARAPQKSRGIFEKRYLQAVDYFESTILSEKSNAHLKIDLTNLERPPEEILAESQNLLMTSQYMEKQQQNWFKAMTNAYCHMSENDIFAIGGVTPFNYTLENRVVIEELVDMEVDAVGLQAGALVYSRKRSMQKYAKGEVETEYDEESKRKLAEVAATVASIPKPAPMTEEEQLFGRIDRKGAAASRDEEGEREEPEAEEEEAVNLSPKGISNFFKGDAKANPTRIGEADQFASELIENMDDRGSGDLMMEQDIPGEGEASKKTSGEGGKGPGGAPARGEGPRSAPAAKQPTRSPLAFKQESTAIHDTDTVEYEKVLDDLTPEAKTRISILFDIKKEEVSQMALHRVTREEMKKYGLPLCDDPGLRPVDKFLVADGVSDEIKFTDEMNQIDEDSLTKEDRQLLSELQGRIRKKQAEVQRLRKLGKVQPPLDWQSADMVGDGPNVGVVDLELQAQRELDALEQALHEKLVARGIRLPDEKNGTWGLGLTYRTNNRRHRLFRSPQADVEFIRYRYFQPSLQAKRRLKMYERKVKLRVRLASFNLPDCVLDRIGELVGHLRYHAGQKILTITADQFPNQHQNTLHCIHVLQQLLNNAMQVLPLYVPFSDLEADPNSIMESKPVPIPEVTPVDDVDPRDSILVERSAFLTKKHNLAPTDYLTPLERQAKRIEDEAALGTSLSSDPSSDRFTLFRFSWDPFVNRQSAQSTL